MHLVLLLVAVFTSWMEPTTKPCFSSSARAASLLKPDDVGDGPASGPVDTTMVHRRARRYLRADFGSWLMTWPSVTVVLAL